MSPAYWIYLAMGITILLNASDIYSRFRLWRLDANRERLKSRLKALTDPPLTRKEFKALPANAALKKPEDPKAVEALMNDLETLRKRCKAQVETSWVTPMGSEMYYRYQEQLTEDVISALLRVASRSAGKAGT